MILIPPLTLRQNVHELHDVKYINDNVDPTLTPMQNSHEIVVLKCINDNVNHATDPRRKWSQT